MTESRQWVYLCSDKIDVSQASLVKQLGGKSISLHRLRSAGCKVPSWFTISADACRAFHQTAAGGFWNSSVGSHLLSQIQEGIKCLEVVSSQIYGTSPRPLRIAVRSGTAVSMPGAMDTLLNCGLNRELIEAEVPQLQTQLWRAYAQFIENFASGHRAQICAASANFNAEPQCDSAENWKAKCDWLLKTFKQQTGKQVPHCPWECLRQSIEAVWRSSSGERATSHRRLMGIDERDSLTAVTVQVMSDVQAAGVLFTRGTAGAHEQSLILEAISQSGQRLVSGQLTPHRYVIPRSIDSSQQNGKAPVSIESPDLAEAAPLSIPQSRELARIGIQLEEAFASPLDIEWGLADGDFVFFQARPIAGETQRNEILRLRTNEIERLKQISIGSSRIWVRHQLAETLPAPTPMTWHIVRRFMGGSGGFGNLYRQLGYQPSKRVCNEGFLELIAGKVYADVERVPELFAAGWPWRYDIDLLRKNASALERAPALFDEKQVNETFLLRLPRLAWIFCRARWRIRHLAQRVLEHFERAEVPRIRDYLAREQQRDLTGYSHDQLLHLLEERSARVLDDFGPATLLPGLFGGLAYSTLEHELISLLGPEAGRELANDLVSGLESDYITQRDEMLWRIAHGEIPLDSFIVEFGHRAIHEMELSVPRWNEDPRTIQQLIELLRSSSQESPLQQRERARQRRTKKMQELENTLAAAGGRSFYSRIRDLVWYASELLPYREIGKNYFMLGYQLIRQVLCEIDRRQNWNSDVFFCSLDELGDLNLQTNESLRELARNRRREWQLTQRIFLPDVIQSTKLDQLTDDSVIQQHVDRSLKATVLSGGSARGPALVIHGHQPAMVNSSGYILICDSLDPGLTPLLATAKGLVVERGGALSHGAVVARQLGVPAFCCPDATRVIRTGDWLVLDSEHALLHVECAND